MVCCMELEIKKFNNWVEIWVIDDESGDFWIVYSEMYSAYREWHDFLISYLKKFENENFDNKLEVIELINNARFIFSDFLSSFENKRGDKMLRVGSGWRNLSKKGTNYITIKITLDSKDYTLLLFENSDKEKKLDYRVMLKE